METNTTRVTISTNRFISIAELINRFILLAAIFIPAGRLDFWQGWLYAGLSTLRLVIAHKFLSGYDELLEERVKPGPGIKQWDKVIYSLYILLLSAMVLIGSLDSGRLGWSPKLPAFVYISAVFINIFGHSISLWAMRVNRFFSSMVRIQTDRGHYVVQEGPYNYIRHPGNLGTILITIGGSLVFGSFWALIPAGIISVLIITRTYLEDKTLKAELPGYIEYTGKVKYRLLPWMW